MPLYALTCLDKPNSLERRLATREAHVTYIRERLSMVKLAGPFLDDAEQMAGSLLIVEADDLAAAQAFSASDPYTLADLWRSVDIRPFKVSIGQL